MGSGPAVTTATNCPSSGSLLDQPEFFRLSPGNNHRREALRQTDLVDAQPNAFPNRLIITTLASKRALCKAPGCFWNNATPLDNLGICPSQKNTWLPAAVLQAYTAKTQHLGSMQPGSARTEASCGRRRMVTSSGDPTPRHYIIEHASGAPRMDISSKRMETARTQDG